MSINERNKARGAGLMTMNYETQLKGDEFRSADFEAGDEALARRKRMILIVAGAAIVILAFVAFKLFGGGADDSSAGAGDQQAQTVTVAIAKPQDVINMVNATGSIGAIRDMPVGVVGEGGRVLSVRAEAGEWVTKGETLVVIERSVQAQEIAGLTAQVEVARADARLAQSNLDRAKALVANGFVSKAQIDQLSATRDAANARTNVAVATLNQARARVGRLDVRAPASGLVLTRSVEAGQIVQSGTVLFRVAEGGRFEAQARLDEGALANIRVGTRATVTPAGSPKSFEGKVWQISPVIDAQSRLGIARIELPYNQALRPGGFATVQISAGDTNSPVLPESAIQSDTQGSYVYIVDDKNKVQRRAIKTGSVTASGVPVVSGLAGQEKVVLFAAGFLNPGEVVKVKIQQPGAAR